MLHMHISIDIIITALSFFITDFLLSSVLNGVSALDGGMVTLSVPFVNPLFCIPAICKKIRQTSPTVFVWFRHKRRAWNNDGFWLSFVGDIAQKMLRQRQNKSLPLTREVARSAGGRDSKKDSAEQDQMDATAA